MSAVGLEGQITELLAALLSRADYLGVLVCTDEGLQLAVAGELPNEEAVAGLTCLFDDVVVRARRDLQLPVVDEITLLVPRSCRYIVRPLALESDPRLFLVLLARPSSTWRRNTSLLLRELIPLLSDLVGVAA